jgi:hypothetical protein
MLDMYTLAAGRCIVQNDKPVMTLHRIGNDHIGYQIDPAEADNLARLIVAALNCYCGHTDYTSAFEAGRESQRLEVLETMKRLGLTHD